MKTLPRIADPYFVGAIVSESGPGASLGRPEADRSELAVSEINAAGGVGGHPLTVQFSTMNRIRRPQ